MSWSAGSRAGVAAVLCLASFVAGALLAAERDPVAPEFALRIGLAGESCANVEVTSETGRVLIDLPANAEVPDRLEEMSGGLVLDGKIEPKGSGRLRIEIPLAEGTLHRVANEPGALVLHFQSRFQAPVTAGEASREYRLGADDMIAIKVYNQPDLDSKLTIDSNGLITAPLVGEVQAAGLTPRQLASKLAQLLGRSYLVDPRVDVQIEEFRSQWVMVAGEVSKPGRISLTGGTRLKEVLGEVEGFSESAGELIKISRRTEGGGAPVTLVVPREEFERGEVNPVLAHGDIIEVSKGEYCFVQGEVDRPGSYAIDRGMTLLKALSLAGGLSDWADRKSVRVLYYQDGKLIDERTFNLKEIERRKAEDPPLHGGEVIMVKKRFL